MSQPAITYVPQHLIDLGVKMGVVLRNSDGTPLLVRKPKQ